MVSQWRDGRWVFLGLVMRGWVIPDDPDVAEDERNAWTGHVRMEPGYQRQTADGWWRVTIPQWGMGHTFALHCPD